jgi:putative ubiquitin-RnfH superfamily antitoxin RatB of RatAB toxin-antitoxin module
MRVSVAVAWPDRQEVLDLDLEEGSTVADALARAQELMPREDLRSMRAGIWSRPCPLDRRLREGDRVELYRPLVADAKQMRRARARRR